MKANPPEDPNIKWSRAKRLKNPDKVPFSPDPEYVSALEDRIAVLDEQNAYLRALVEDQKADYDELYKMMQISLDELNKMIKELR